MENTAENTKPTELYEVPKSKVSYSGAILFIVFFEILGGFLTGLALKFIFETNELHADGLDDWNFTYLTITKIIMEALIVVLWVFVFPWFLKATLFEKTYIYRLRTDSVQGYAIERLYIHLSGKASKHKWERIFTSSNKQTALNILDDISKGLPIKKPETVNNLGPYSDSVIKIINQINRYKTIK